MSLHTLRPAPIKRGMFEHLSKWVDLAIVLELENVYTSGVRRFEHLWGLQEAPTINQTPWGPPSHLQLHFFGPLLFWRLTRSSES